MRPLVLLLVVGCATAPKAPAEPRSSVDVLLHRAVELKLTPAQLEKFQSLEDRRAARSERLRMDLRLKYESTTAGDNTRRNLGSHAGVVEYQERLIDTRKKLHDLDTDALHDAEALLQPDQLELAEQYVSAWRSRGVGVEEAGED